jgi:AraC-like DNA-binding protein
MCTFKTRSASPVFHDDKLDFKRHSGCVNVEFPYGQASMTLRCEFLAYGYHIRKERMAFLHPSPLFARLFLFHGKGAERFASGVRRVLKPGVIYLIPPTQSFEVRYYANSELLFSHLHVCDSTMTPIFAGMDGLPEINDPELAGRMLSAWNAGKLLQFQLLVAEAVSVFAESRAETMKTRFDVTRKIGQLFEIIRQTDLSELRVDSLAEAMGMSGEALSKSFARSMGISLKRYITEIQLKSACELLLFTNAEIFDIAAKLGHCDVHYFHRFFKKHTGMTPNAYRKSFGDRREQ